MILCNTCFPFSALNISWKTPQIKDRVHSKTDVTLAYYVPIELKVNTLYSLSTNSWTKRSYTSAEKNIGGCIKVNRKVQNYVKVGVFSNCILSFFPCRFLFFEWPVTFIYSTSCCCQTQIHYFAEADTLRLIAMFLYQ